MEEVRPKKDFPVGVLPPSPSCQDIRCLLSDGADIECQRKRLFKQGVAQMGSKGFYLIVYKTCLNSRLSLDTKAQGGTDAYNRLNK